MVCATLAAIFEARVQSKLTNLAMLLAVFEALGIRPPRGVLIHGPPVRQPLHILAPTAHTAYD